MNEEIVNPFNVTKAVDLTHQQIRDTWVDLSGSGSLVSLAKPRSPMPMLLLGGKGSGRTHLLRYFSYPVQLLRHGRGLAAGIAADSYLGVFVQCDGLNAGRFSGPLLPPEGWQAAFAYYMDVWLAQLALGTLIDLRSRLDWQIDEARLVTGFQALVDLSGLSIPASLLDARTTLERLQQEVDVAVNNAPLLRAAPAIRIRSSRGFVFEFARLLWRVCPALEGMLLVYLIDEVENIGIDAQRYLNTLVREKQSPVTFKIGCRTHGLKTLETLSSGERNRDGAEFERVELDEYFRSRQRQYGAFSRKLVAKRLSSANLLSMSLSEIERLKEQDLRSIVDMKFETPSSADFEAESLQFVRDRYQPHERPYFVELQRKLEASKTTLREEGLFSSRPDDVLENLFCESHPLLERANVYLLYKAWYERRSLSKASIDIAKACSTFLRDPQAKSKYKQLLGHFRADLLAQLFSECRQPQRYVGFDTFIQMSGGFPRHLLIVLKSVHKWAIFNGEDPFRETPVSLRSQQQGVLQASNWYFDDARVIGEDPAALQSAVDRLAGLFRALRFSDKPVEPSLISFSCDEEAIGPRARSVLYAAEQSSLLLRIAGGHKNRNTKRLNACLQLNPMLCPRYDLALGRRGVIELTIDETDAIFDPGLREKATKLLRARVARTTSPFGRSRVDVQQPSLFDDP